MISRRTEIEKNEGSICRKRQVKKSREWQWMGHNLLKGNLKTHYKFILAALWNIDHKAQARKEKRKHCNCSVLGQSKLISLDMSMPELFTDIIMSHYQQMPIKKVTRSQALLTLSEITERLDLHCVYMLTMLLFLCSVLGSFISWKQKITNVFRRSKQNDRKS